MAKLDMQMAIRYLTLGAGAVIVPAVVGSVSQLSVVTDNTLMQFPLFMGIKVGGLVLAAVGVGIADQLTSR